MNSSDFANVDILNHLGPAYSFLGLRPPESDFTSAEVIVVPVPYDGTTTYRVGTREGPRAILQASRELELYDEETQTEAYRRGIYTLDEVAVTVSSPRDMIDRVRDIGKWILETGKMPVLLGGEHLLSLGMIEALADLISPLTILHLDAHADLRAQYQGSAFSNACVMRQVFPHASLVQVGIRSLSKEEHDFIRQREIPCFFAYRLREDPQLWEQIISSLGPWVYITIDLDVFDPSIMPAVGTPEPGGLNWNEVMSLLKRVIQERRVVGFDVMELLPLPYCAAPDVLAARLVYKLLSYIFLGNNSLDC